MTKQSGEPLLVEGGVHARRLSLGCRPELACVRRLPPRGQAARPKQRSDEPLKSLCTRERDAGFPVLHRAQADARARRELALDQARPTAMAQQQATKGLRRVLRIHDPPNTPQIIPRSLAVVPPG